MKSEKQSTCQMSHLIDVLVHSGCSLVVASVDGDISTYHSRGVKDLHMIVKTRPELLRRAMVADKAIGKGAAALMAKGGVSEVYTLLISRPALQLLVDHGVSVTYDTLVDNIINRAGTGICPVETLCLPCDTIDECIVEIDKFVQRMAQNN